MNKQVSKLKNVRMTNVVIVNKVDSGGSGRQFSYLCQVLFLDSTFNFI
jgi:hypothetical protein